MRVAFYAPLKSPEHPVPSGDRRVGQALVQALRTAGHDVSIAAHLRSFDAHGDAARQTRLARIAARVADRLLARYRDGRAAPQAWFTYHVYHKAPDCLGPRISAALDIPYIVAEASVAPRQRDGPWAVGYAEALHAIRCADAIVFLNPADVEQVVRARAGRGISVAMRPFLDVAAFAGTDTSAHRPAQCNVRLVTVAMMRAGPKLASYRVLASALRRISSPRWELTIVGDGPERAQVESLFAAFTPGQVRMTGQLSGEEIAAHLRDSDVFVWPAIDEAFGMVFLEAQACGLPVVGGAGTGVGAVVADGRSGFLTPLGDVDALARALHGLITDANLRVRTGRAARAYVREHHDLAAAARRLDALLSQALAEHRASPRAAGVPASC